MYRYIDGLHVYERYNTPSVVWNPRSFTRNKEQIDEIQFLVEQIKSKNVQRYKPSNSYNASSIMAIMIDDEMNKNIEKLESLIIGLLGYHYTREIRFNKIFKTKHVLSLVFSYSSDFIDEFFELNVKKCVENLNILSKYTYSLKAFSKNEFIINIDCSLFVRKQNLKMQNSYDCYCRIIDEINQKQWNNKGYRIVTGREAGKYFCSLDKQIYETYVVNYIKSINMVFEEYLKSVSIVYAKCFLDSGKFVFLYSCGYDERLKTDYRFKKLKLPLKANESMVICFEGYIQDIFISSIELNDLWYSADPVRISYSFQNLKVLDERLSEGLGNDNEVYLYDGCMILMNQ